MSVGRRLHVLGIDPSDYEPYVRNNDLVIDELSDDNFVYGNDVTFSDSDESNKDIDYIVYVKEKPKLDASERPTIAGVKVRGKFRNRVTALNGVHANDFYGKHRDFDFNFDEYPDLYVGRDAETGDVIVIEYDGMKNPILIKRDPESGLEYVAHKDLSGGNFKVIRMGDGTQQIVGKDTEGNSYVAASFNKPHMTDASGNTISGATHKGLSRKGQLVLIERDPLTNTPILFGRDENGVPYVVNQDAKGKDLRVITDEATGTSKIVGYDAQGKEVVFANDVQKLDGTATTLGGKSLRSARSDRAHARPFWGYEDGTGGDFDVAEDDEGNVLIVERNEDGAPMIVKRNKKTNEVVRITEDPSGMPLRIIDRGGQQVILGTDLLGRDFEMGRLLKGKTVQGRKEHAQGMVVLGGNSTVRGVDSSGRSVVIRETDRGPTVYGRNENGEPFVIDRDINGDPLVISVDSSGERVIQGKDAKNMPYVIARAGHDAEFLPKDVTDSHDKLNNLPFVVGQAWEGLSRHNTGMNPNGSKLVFVTKGRLGQPAVVTEDASGQRVVVDRDLSGKPLQIVKTQSGQRHVVGIAPNGEQYILASVNPDAHATHRSAIDADTGEDIIIVDEPNSGPIVYNYDEAGAPRAISVDNRGNRLRIIQNRVEGTPIVVGGDESGHVKVYAQGKQDPRVIRVGTGSNPYTNYFNPRDALGVFGKDQLTTGKTPDGESVFIELDPHSGALVIVRADQTGRRLVQSADAHGAPLRVEMSSDGRKVLILGNDANGATQVYATVDRSNPQEIGVDPRGRIAAAYINPSSSNESPMVIIKNEHGAPVVIKSTPNNSFIKERRPNGDTIVYQQGSDGRKVQVVTLPASGTAVVGDISNPLIYRKQDVLPSLDASNTQALYKIGPRGVQDFTVGKDENGNFIVIDRDIESGHPIIVGVDKSGKKVVIKRDNMGEALKLKTDPATQKTLVIGSDPMGGEKVFATIDRKRNIRLGRDANGRVVANIFDERMDGSPIVVGRDFSGTPYIIHNDASNKPLTTAKDEKGDIVVYGTDNDGKKYLISTIPQKHDVIALDHASRPVIYQDSAPRVDIKPKTQFNRSDFGPLSAPQTTPEIGFSGTMQLAKDRHNQYVFVESDPKTGAPIIISSDPNTHRRVVINRDENGLALKVVQSPTDPDVLHIVGNDLSGKQLKYATINRKSNIRLGQDPNGKVVATAFDGDGVPVVITRDAQGAPVVIKQDAQKRPLQSEVTPQGDTIIYGMDPSGKRRVMSKIPQQYDQVEVSPNFSDSFYGNSSSFYNNNKMNISAPHNISSRHSLQLSPDQLQVGTDTNGRVYLIEKNRDTGLPNLIFSDSDGNRVTLQHDFHGDPLRTQKDGSITHFIGVAQNGTDKVYASSIPNVYHGQDISGNPVAVRINPVTNAPSVITQNANGAPVVIDSSRNNSSLIFAKTQHGDGVVYGKGPDGRAHVIARTSQYPYDVPTVQLDSSGKLVSLGREQPVDVSNERYFNSSPQHMPVDFKNLGTNDHPPFIIGRDASTGEFVVVHREPRSDKPIITKRDMINNRRIVISSDESGKPLRIGPGRDGVHEIVGEDASGRRKVFALIGPRVSIAVGLDANNRTVIIQRVSPESEEVLVSGADSNGIPYIIENDVSGSPLKITTGPDGHQIVQGRTLSGGNYLIARNFKLPDTYDFQKKNLQSLPFVVGQATNQFTDQGTPQLAFISKNVHGNPIVTTKNSEGKKMIIDSDEQGLPLRTVLGSDGRYNIVGNDVSGKQYSVATVSANAASKFQAAIDPRTGEGVVVSQDDQTLDPIIYKHDALGAPSSIRQDLSGQFLKHLAVNNDPTSSGLIMGYDQSNRPLVYAKMLSNPSVGGDSSRQLFDNQRKTPATGTFNVGLDSKGSYVFVETDPITNQPIIIEADSSGQRRVISTDRLGDAFRFELTPDGGKINVVGADASGVDRVYASIDRSNQYILGQDSMGRVAAAFVDPSDGKPRIVVKNAKGVPEVIEADGNGHSFRMEKTTAGETIFVGENRNGQREVFLRAPESGPVVAMNDKNEPIAYSKLDFNGGSGSHEKSPFADIAFVPRVGPRGASAFVVAQTPSGVFVIVERVPLEGGTNGALIITSDASGERFEISKDRTGLPLKFKNDEKDKSHALIIGLDSEGKEVTYATIDRRRDLRLAQDVNGRVCAVIFDKPSEPILVGTDHNNAPYVARCDGKNNPWSHARLPDGDSIIIGVSSNGGSSGSKYIAARIPSTAGIPVIGMDISNKPIAYMQTSAFIPKPADSKSPIMIKDSEFSPIANLRKFPLGNLICAQDANGRNVIVETDITSGTPVIISADAQGKRRVTTQDRSGNQLRFRFTAESLHLCRIIGKDNSGVEYLYGTIDRMRDLRLGQDAHGRIIAASFNDNADKSPVIIGKDSRGLVYTLDSDSRKAPFYTLSDPMSEDILICGEAPDNSKQAIGVIPSESTVIRILNSIIRRNVVHSRNDATSTSPQTDSAAGPRGGGRLTVGKDGHGNFVLVDRDPIAGTPIVISRGADGNRQVIFRDTMGQPLRVKVDATGNKYRVIGTDVHQAERTLAIVDKTKDMRMGLDVNGRAVCIFFDERSDGAAVIVGRDHDNCPYVIDKDGAKKPLRTGRTPDGTVLIHGDSSTGEPYVVARIPPGNQDIVGLDEDNVPTIYAQPLSAFNKKLNANLVDNIEFAVHLGELTPINVGRDSKGKWIIMETDPRSGRPIIITVDEKNDKLVIRNDVFGGELKARKIGDILTVYGSDANGTEKVYATVDKSMPTHMGQNSFGKMLVVAIPPKEHNKIYLIGKDHRGAPYSLSEDRSGQPFTMTNHASGSKYVYGKMANGERYIAAIIPPPKQKVSIDIDSKAAGSRTGQLVVGKDLRGNFVIIEYDPRSGSPVIIGLDSRGNTTTINKDLLNEPLEIRDSGKPGVRCVVGRDNHGNELVFAEINSNKDCRNGVDMNGRAVAVFFDENPEKHPIVVGINHLGVPYVLDMDVRGKPLSAAPSGDGDLCIFGVGTSNESYMICRCALTSSSQLTNEEQPFIVGRLVKDNSPVIIEKDLASGNPVVIMKDPNTNMKVVIDKDERGNKLKIITKKDGRKAVIGYDSNNSVYEIAIFDDSAHIILGRDDQGKTVVVDLSNLSNDKGPLVVGRDVDGAPMIIQPTGVKQFRTKFDEETRRHVIVADDENGGERVICSLSGVISPEERNQLLGDLNGKKTNKKSAKARLEEFAAIVTGPNVRSVRPPPISFKPFMVGLEFETNNLLIMEIDNSTSDPIIIIAKNISTRSTQDAAVDTNVSDLTVLRRDARGSPFSLLPEGPNLVSIRGRQVDGSQYIVGHVRVKGLIDLGRDGNQQPCIIVRDPITLAPVIFGRCRETETVEQARQQQTSGTPNDQGDNIYGTASKDKEKFEQTATTLLKPYIRARDALGKPLRLIRDALSGTVRVVGVNSSGEVSTLAFVKPDSGSSSQSIAPALRGIYIGRRCQPNQHRIGSDGEGAGAILLIEGVSSFTAQGQSPSNAKLGMILFDDDTGVSSKQINDSHGRPFRMVAYPFENKALRMHVDVNSEHHALAMLTSSDGLPVAHADVETLPMKATASNGKDGLVFIDWITLAPVVVVVSGDSSQAGPPTNYSSFTSNPAASFHVIERDMNGDILRSEYRSDGSLWIVGVDSLGVQYEIAKIDTDDGVSDNFTTIAQAGNKKRKNVRLDGGRTSIVLSSPGHRAAFAAALNSANGLNLGSIGRVYKGLLKTTEDEGIIIETSNKKIFTFFQRDSNKLPISLSDNFKELSLLEADDGSTSLSGISNIGLKSMVASCAPLQLFSPGLESAAAPAAQAGSYGREVNPIQRSLQVGYDKDGKIVVLFQRKPRGRLILSTRNADGSSKILTQDELTGSALTLEERLDEKTGSIVTVVVPIESKGGARKVALATIRQGGVYRYGWDAQGRPLAFDRDANARPVLIRMDLMGQSVPRIEDRDKDGGEFKLLVSEDETVYLLGSRGGRPYKVGAGPDPNTDLYSAWTPLGKMVMVSFSTGPNGTIHPSPQAAVNAGVTPTVISEDAEGRPLLISQDEMGRPLLVRQDGKTGGLRIEGRTASGSLQVLCHLTSQRPARIALDTSGRRTLGVEWNVHGCCMLVGRSENTAVYMSHDSASFTFKVSQSNDLIHSIIARNPLPSVAFTGGLISHEENGAHYLAAYDEHVGIFSSKSHSRIPVIVVLDEKGVPRLAKVIRDPAGYPFRIVRKTPSLSIQEEVGANVSVLFKSSSSDENTVNDSTKLQKSSGQVGGFAVSEAASIQLALKHSIVPVASSITLIGRTPRAEGGLKKISLTHDSTGRSFLEMRELQTGQTLVVGRDDKGNFEVYDTSPLGLAVRLGIAFREEIKPADVLACRWGSARTLYRADWRDFEPPPNSFDEVDDVNGVSDSDDDSDVNVSNEIQDYTGGKHMFGGLKHDASAAAHLLAGKLGSIFGAVQALTYRRRHGGSTSAWREVSRGSDDLLGHTAASMIQSSFLRWKCRRECAALKIQTFFRCYGERQALIAMSKKIRFATSVLSNFTRKTVWRKRSFFGQTVNDKEADDWMKQRRMEEYRSWFREKMVGFGSSLVFGGTQQDTMQAELDHQIQAIKQAEKLAKSAVEKAKQQEANRLYELETTIEKVFSRPGPWHSPPNEAKLLAKRVIAIQASKSSGLHDDDDDHTNSFSLKQKMITKHFVTPAIFLKQALTGAINQNDSNGGGDKDMDSYLQDEKGVVDCVQHGLDLQTDCATCKFIIMDAHRKQAAVAAIHHYETQVDGLIPGVGGLKPQPLSFTSPDGRRKMAGVDLMPSSLSRIARKTLSPSRNRGLFSTSPLNQSPSVGHRGLVGEETLTPSRIKEIIEMTGGECREHRFANSHENAMGCSVCKAIIIYNRQKETAGEIINKQIPRIANETDDMEDDFYADFPSLSPKPTSPTPRKSDCHIHTEPHRYSTRASRLSIFTKGDFPLPGNLMEEENNLHTALSTARRSVKSNYAPMQYIGAPIDDIIASRRRVNFDSARDTSHSFAIPQLSSILGADIEMQPRKSRRSVAPTFRTSKMSIMFDRSDVADDSHVGDGASVTSDAAI